MSNSYKFYSDTKDIMKKYVNATEGAIIYGISKSRIMVLAAEAGAVYKVGNSALINTDIFEMYLEKFKEPTRPLPKHIWIAKELKRRGLAEAKVFLAVGLPLTRFGAEKNDFIKYLTKNKRVSFKYENEPYYIEIDDVAVFPQCYAAVVDKIPTMAKKTLIVDIGSWTIDIMPVINKSPDESKCVTIPKGLITCMRSINEQCVRQLNGEVDESEIQNIMRYGRSDIDDEYFAIIKAEIEDFVDKVYNSIREFGYNLKTTPIVFVGGGAVVMKNFGSHDAKNISYNLDVKANARGYEQLATMGLKSTKRLS